MLVAPVALVVATLQLAVAALQLHWKLESRNYANAEGLSAWLILGRGRPHNGLTESESPLPAAIVRSPFYLADPRSPTQDQDLPQGLQPMTQGTMHSW